MTIIGQQTHQTGKSAARQFWDDQTDKHPKVHGVLSILASVFGYIFNGHIVLGAAKWGITVGGRIATSILFFAALWVAGRSTEPASLAHLLNYLPLIRLSAPQVDHIAILSFTLLPEVLLLGAGLTTIEQWVGVKRQGGLYWVWALIYSLLTALFLGITIYTFISFLVNGSASVAINASGKADGATLIRALTGWSYALLELLHAGVGARYGSATDETTTTALAVQVQTLISQAIEELASRLQVDQVRRFGELAQQQEQGLLTALQEVKASVPPLPAETLKEAVSVACETLLPATLETLLKERSTVSSAPETGQAAGPSSVSHVSRRNTGSKKAATPTRVTPAGEDDPETVVYRLLDEDSSRTHRIIARMTGIPDTTVYRIRKRYLAERRNTVPSEPETSDTAM
jgi:hypothetical protein